MCAQDLTAALVARVQAGPTEVVEELKARLALKEKLFQELLSDRSHRSNEHQTQVQDLLNTLSSKDQYLQVGCVAGLGSVLYHSITDYFTHLTLFLPQDNSYRLSVVISERTGQLQELRRQLSLREQELCELRRDKEREIGGETEHLQSLLKEKEAFIKVYIHIPLTFLCSSLSCRADLHSVHHSSGADAGPGGGNAVVLKRERGRDEGYPRGAAADTEEGEGSSGICVDTVIIQKS